MILHAYTDGSYTKNKPQTYGWASVIYDENDFVLAIKALKSNENYFWSYKISYFKKLINGEWLVYGIEII